MPPQDNRVQKKKKHRWLKVVALILCVAIIGSAAGIVSYYAMKDFNRGSGHEDVVGDIGDSDEPGNTAPEEDKTDKPESIVSGKVLTTYTGPGNALTPMEIYDNYASACVGISTEITGTNIFGQITSTPVSGSGFIISPDGYIITNAHVVSKGTDFEVLLFDGTTHDATLIGADTAGDVALMKIDVDYDLNYVVLGNMDECRVGEEVSVIGNPLGELTFTLTTGHVSALDRSINVDGTFQNMFQIDAAINSGNSGGPVFNSKGEVIGVATAKYSLSGVEGLAFALPIDDVVDIANDISQYGYVKGRAYMGIYYYDVDAQYAYYYSVPTGVYVESTVEGGCAEKAGIKHGDIITAINGVKVVSGAQLKAEIAKFSAGDTTSLTIYREGETLEVRVAFDEYVPERVATRTSVD
jgi:serine protease Do